jgi:hypothetical protein
METLVFESSSETSGEVSGTLIELFMNNEVISLHDMLSLQFQLAIISFKVSNLNNLRKLVSATLETSMDRVHDSHQVFEPRISLSRICDGMVSA